MQPDGRFVTLESIRRQLEGVFGSALKLGPEEFGIVPRTPSEMVGQDKEVFPQSFASSSPAAG